MTPLLKYTLVVLLLVSGVVGCDPYHRYPSYGRDRYGSPYYYGPGWGRPRYEQPWRSDGPYGEYRGWHHHDHDRDDG